MNRFREALDLTQYEGTRVVAVGCVSGGYILTGKRRDNGKWTHPAGHAEPGEDIITAAQREVREESGIEVDRGQLEFLGIKKVEKGRGGFPFVLALFLAHIDKEKATSKDDPDKEVSTWKWVQINKETPELQADVRHAAQDDILIHLGVNQPLEARMKSRTMAEVSKDLQTAGFDESGHSQVDPQVIKAQKEEAERQAIAAATPAPGPKTPAEMTLNPESYLPDEQVTGD